MNGEAEIGKCASGGNECAQAMAAIMGARAHELYWRAPYTLDRHLDALEEIYADAQARNAERPPALPSGKPCRTTSMVKPIDAAPD